jgi:hypothetical protein
MAKKPLNVEEPGAAPAEEATAEATEGADVQTSASPAEEGAQPAPVPELAPEEQLPVIDKSPQGVPDQADVDPTKIKTMTLSKQGWVLPAALGEQAKG